MAQKKGNLHIEHSAYFSMLSAGFWFLIFFSFLNLSTYFGLQPFLYYPLGLAVSLGQSPSEFYICDIILEKTKVVCHHKH